MKKILFLLLLVSGAGYAQFVTPPKVLPHSYVQDYDHVLTSGQILKLNQRIDTITKHFSVQMAVVILSDLQGYEIEQAALNIGRDWGIGLKDTNNGIVYLISPKMHRARLEIGYGLEGNIPDITAQIIGDDATSFYKKGDWYGGIDKVLTEVTEKLDKQSPGAGDGSSGDIWKVLAGAILFIGLCVIVWFTFLREKEEVDDDTERPFYDPPPPSPNVNGASFLAGAALASTVSKEDEDDDDDEDSSSSSYTSSSSSDDDDDSSFGGFGGSSGGSSDSDYGSYGGGSFGGGGATSGW